VIATSRERLQVYGEHIYPLPALALPPRAPHLTLAQVAQSDAVKLFLARANAAQPQLTLNTDNAQTIAEICQRLEGMPLAIELAAAQLTHFSLTALNEQLQSAPLQALTLATRDVEPRQRTLRNSLQWSYDLLTAAERSLFAQLGVFVGGFTTAAAQAVCPLADEESLLGLADRHLIRREADQRWSLLELVREFALEQLAIPVLRDTRQRHAEYFTQHFAAITAATSDAGEFFKVVNNELPNARAALYWLLAQQNPLAGVLGSHHRPCLLQPRADIRRAALVARCASCRFASAPADPASVVFLCVCLCLARRGVWPSYCLRQTGVDHRACPSRASADGRRLGNACSHPSVDR